MRILFLSVIVNCLILLYGILKVGAINKLPFLTTNDFHIYKTIAQTFYVGTGDVRYAAEAVGYPLLLKLFSVFGGYEIGAVVFNTIVMTLLPIAVYIFFKHHSKHAFGIAMVAMFYPFLINVMDARWLNFGGYSEPLFLLLLFVGLHYIVNKDNNVLGALFIAGCGLVKIPHGAIAVITILVYVVIYNRRNFQYILIVSMCGIVINLAIYAFVFGNPFMFIVGQDAFQFGERGMWYPFSSYVYYLMYDTSNILVKGYRIAHLMVITGLVMISYKINKKIFVLSLPFWLFAICVYGGDNGAYQAGRYMLSIISVYLVLGMVIMSMKKNKIIHWIAEGLVAGIIIVLMLGAFVYLSIEKKLHGWLDR